MRENIVNVDEIIEEYKGKSGALLSIMERVQQNSDHSYLSEQTLLSIAEKLNLPLSKVYSVATFYSFFNLKPQGEHIITVCRGTACHTRGSKPLLQDCMALLGLEESEDGEGEHFFTTEDMRFTVRTVACFGQCALAPVISIDGIIHSRMTGDTLKDRIVRLVKQEVGK